jgi:hypothetical protein
MNLFQVNLFVNEFPPDAFAQQAIAVVPMASHRPM